MLNDFILLIASNQQWFFLLIIVIIAFLVLKNTYETLISVLILRWGYLIKENQAYLKELMIFLPRKRRWLFTIKTANLSTFQGAKSYADSRDLFAFIPQSYQEEKQISFFTTAVQQLAKSFALIPPNFDHRLYMMSKILGEALLQGQTFPHHHLIRFACSHVGLAHQFPKIYCLKVLEQQDLSLVFDQIRSIFIDQFEQRKFDDQRNQQLQKKQSAAFDFSCYLLNDHQKKIRHLIVVVLDQKIKLTKPFLRIAPKQWKVNVVGEYLEWPAPLSVLYRYPSGKLIKGEVKQQNQHFSFDLPQDAFGAFQVELLSNAFSTNQEILMSFPWWHGEEDLPTSEIAITASFPSDDRFWIEHLRFYSLIAQHRLKHMLRPVHLAIKAKQILKKYHEIWFQYHTMMDQDLSQMPTLETFAKTNGMTEIYGLSRRIDGVDIEDIWDKLLSSPSQSMILNSPDMSKVALRIFEKSTHQLLQSQGLLHVYLLALKSPQKLNLKKDLALAYRWIQDQRKNEQQNRLPIFEPLEKIAHQVAHAIAIGQCQHLQVKDHVLHLIREEFKTEYEISAFAFPLYHLDDHSVFKDIVRPNQSWLIPHAKGIGVGLAQQKSQMIWMVVIVRI
jgi:hypothetical protein